MYLWDAHRKVTGALLPGRDQGQVGSCVGFGFCRAAETLMCVEIASGDAEEFRELSPEAIYGLSRVEVGGRQIPATEDGSTGAWAAEALTRWGVLARDRYDGLDLSRYDEATCRRLGAEGLPPALEAVAKQHPVRTASMVRTVADVRLALANGYPVVVCSNQGFDRQRDQDGVCQPTEVWDHCMAILGYDGDRYFLDNSWSDQYFVGPVGPGDPPPSGFWTISRVIERMVGQRDSYALSAFQGFQARKVLDWI
jgi:hypothetical protein